MEAIEKQRCRYSIQTLQSNFINVTIVIAHKMRSKELQSVMNIHFPDKYVPEGNEPNKIKFELGNISVSKALSLHH